jgi:hypothetical protein
MSQANTARIKVVRAHVSHHKPLQRTVARPLRGHFLQMIRLASDTQQSSFSLQLWNEGQAKCGTASDAQ